MSAQQYELVDSSETAPNPNAGNVAITPVCELGSDVSEAVEKYRDQFGFKEFILSQVQDLPNAKVQYSTGNVTPLPEPVSNFMCNSFVSIR